MGDLSHIGVILEVGAGFAGTAGKQLVSYSARTESAIKSKVCFVGGLCITTFIGPVLDAAAFAFAAQSVVAPLNGLDVTWNTLFAPCTLGETLQRGHKIGTAMVATGAVLTAIVGPSGGKIVTLEDVTSKLYRWTVALYLLAFFAFCYICYRVIRSRPVGVGDKARGLALGAVAGSLAGNMYFCTCTVSLVRRSLESGDWSAWQHCLPYVLTLGTISVALGNIPIISMALREYEAVFMVTLFEGCHIAVACISGAVVLQELEHIETRFRTVAYCLTVLEIFVGLYVLQTTTVKGIGKVTVGQPLGPTTSSQLRVRSRLRPTTFHTLGELRTEKTGASVVWASSWAGIARSGPAEGEEGPPGGGGGGAIQMGGL